MPAQSTQFASSRSRFTSIRLVQLSLRFSGILSRIGRDLKIQISASHGRIKRPNVPSNPPAGHTLNVLKSAGNGFSRLMEVELTHFPSKSMTRVGRARKCVDKDEARGQEGTTAL